MMLSLVVLFAAALVPISEIYGKPALSLNDILNVLEAQQKKSQELSSSSSSSNEATLSDNNDSDQDLTLRGTQLVRFLQQARDKENNRQLTENKRLSKLYTHLTNVDDNGLSRYLVKNKESVASYDDNKNAHSLDNFINSLLSETNKKQQRVDNRDDTVVKLNDREDVDDGNLNDYSRIYVILNPEALQSSPNKKKLSGLISRLMSKSSSVTESRLAPKQAQYKGFPVRDTRSLSQRRSRRDSMEYGGRDSMDDSYSKKRPRYNNYYGGGGGGGGGRTAIPYIRHRGDIFERAK